VLELNTVLGYTCQVRNTTLHPGGYYAINGSNMDIEDWKKKNSCVKGYSHFDKKVSLVQCWSYISNPDNIKRHSFYPFIHYSINNTKYNKEKGVVPKFRDICYPAHIDRCIYQYYSFLLNQKYNQRVIADGISESAIAYRNNLGMSNINFAKRAFDFIRNFNSCYIIVGDFTDFFGSIDHKYLKKQLLSLLVCKSLPPDYYAVYKNITRYSVWDLESLLALNGLKKSKAGVKALNDKVQVLSHSDFKKYKSQYVKPNKETYGIPQGSPISAVLSNIYMLEFDKLINEYVKINNGLYMRYSDDFIIVFPNVEKSTFKEHLKWVQDTIRSIPHLTLQSEKTQIFHFDSKRVRNCNDEFLERVKRGKNVLNYLGFAFDGDIITVRDKTITKYYYRLYRKIKTIVKNNGYTYKGNKIGFKKLYLMYSCKGAHVGNGNFLTYIERCERVFGKGEAINRGTKRHLQKIRKRLNKIPK